MVRPWYKHCLPGTTQDKQPEFLNKFLNIVWRMLKCHKKAIFLGLDGSYITVFRVTHHIRRGSSLAHVHLV